MHGNFQKLDLVSCTADPGYDGERFLGIRIEYREEVEDKRVAATTNTNSGYMTEQKESNTSLKEISLNKSISGGIVVDDSVSIITVEDSIVDNLGGSAIDTKVNNKREKNPILKLEARRSDILSDYQDPYILELDDICCTDSILTSKVSVSVKEKKQNQTDDDEYDGDGSNNSCTFMRYCRYEPGSRFEKIRKDNGVIVDFAVNCTPDRPIFVSTTFGDPGYLHLHHLSSKSILERAENTLEMGAFNKNYKPLRIRNLNLRLREFLPLGIRSGVIYVY